MSFFGNLFSKPKPAPPPPPPPAPTPLPQPAAPPRAPAESAVVGPASIRQKAGRAQSAEMGGSILTNILQRRTPNTGRRTLG